MWGGGGLYDRWATFLDQWGTGAQVDPTGLPKLVPEDFTPDGWVRLTNRLTSALEARLVGWADALSRAMGDARDEFTVARALAQARAGLRSVRAVAAHPSLPPDLSKRLLGLVDTQINSSQQALESSVDRMRREGATQTAVEARRRTIRDNSLVVTTQEAPPAAGPAWAAPATEPGRRRIVIPGK